MVESKRVGDFIKKRRKSLGLLQSDIAERLFVSREAVSKWENGHHLPDVDVLESLSRMLGVSVDTLLQGGPAEEDRSSTSDEKNGSKTQHWIRCGFICALVVLIAISAAVLFSVRYIPYDPSNMNVCSERVYSAGDDSLKGVIYLLESTDHNTRWSRVNTRSVDLNSGESILVVSPEIRSFDSITGNYDKEGFVVLEYIQDAEEKTYDYLFYYPGNINDLHTITDLAGLYALLENTPGSYLQKCDQ